MTLVFEVPEEHDVQRHRVLLGQVLNDPLGGDIDRGGDDSQPVAGVQLLRRRGVEALLECRLEYAALAVTGESLSTSSWARLRTHDP